MHRRSRNFLIVVASAAAGFGGSMAAAIIRAIFNFEVERAWDATIKGVVKDGMGWPEGAAMLEAMDESFWAGVLLVLAVWGTLELFYAWRRQRKTETMQDASILLEWGDDWRLAKEPSYDNAYRNVDHWHVAALGGSVYVTILFQAPIERPHIYVVATSENVKWRELQVSERHVIVEIEGRQKNSKILLPMKAEKFQPSDARRQQPYVWQDAMYLKDIPIVLEEKPRWWGRLRLRLSRA